MTYQSSRELKAKKAHLGSLIFADLNFIQLTINLTNGFPHLHCISLSGYPQNMHPVVTWFKVHCRLHERPTPRLKYYQNTRKPPWTIVQDIPSNLIINKRLNKFQQICVAEKSLYPHVYLIATLKFRNCRSLYNWYIFTGTKINDQFFFLFDKLDVVGYNSKYKLFYL